MYKVLTISIVLFLGITAGCGSKDILDSPAPKGQLLTIDFHEGKLLRYSFVSERQTLVDWDPQNNNAAANDSVENKSSEKLSIIMSYTPLDIDPFGLTKIKATCESVKVVRSDGTKQDAVEFFKGKSYTASQINR